MTLKPELLQEADIAPMLSEIEFEIIKNGSYNRPKGTSIESRWLSTNINFDHKIDEQGNIWAITDNSAEIIYCVEVNHTQPKPPDHLRWQSNHCHKWRMGNGKRYRH
jgi:hypothetical protein